MLIRGIAQDPDTGQGGGQSGAGAGGNGDGGNAGGNAGGDPPKYLTIDEFNKAFSAREKRFSTSIEKMLADGFAKIAPKQAEPDEDDEDDEPAGSGAANNAGGQGAAGQGQQAAQADPKTAKELRKLQKRLDASEKERDAEKKAREEQVAKSQREELRNKLSEQLATAGITGAKLRGAIALLTEEGRVKRDQESGAILFVDGDDETDLAEGLKKWFGTDDGKSFLPPRGAQGAGTERPRGGTNKTSNDPKAAREEKARGLFRKAFGLPER